MAHDPIAARFAKHLNELLELHFDDDAEYQFMPPVARSDAAAPVIEDATGQALRVTFVDGREVFISIVQTK